MNLIAQRDNLIANNPNPDNVLGTLLYTNTIQQNINLSKTYKDDISEYNYDIERNKVSLEEAKSNIQKLQSEMQDLEFRKCLCI